MAIINGDNASNQLNGTNLADRIFGLGGNDILIGFDGDDDRSGAYPEWIKEDKRFADKKTEQPFRANGNSFSAVAAVQTELRGPEAGPYARMKAGWRGPRPTRSALRDRRVRPLVTMHWARSGRSGTSRRRSAAAAPWHA